MIGWPTVRTRAAGNQPDACMLIDPAQAGRILGHPITVHPVDTKLASSGAASMCNYSSGHMRGGFMLLAAHLSVTDLAREMASEKKEIRDESIKALNITPKISDVSGLGAAAFLVDSGGFLQLHIFAHGNKLVLNRNAKATPKVVNETEQLARAALARLK